MTLVRAMEPPSYLHNRVRQLHVQLPEPILSNSHFSAHHSARSFKGAPQIFQTSVQCLGRLCTDAVHCHRFAMGVRRIRELNNLDFRRNLEPACRCVPAPVVDFANEIIAGRWNVFLSDRGHKLGLDVGGIVTLIIMVSYSLPRPRLSTD